MPNDSGAPPTDATVMDVAMEVAPDVVVTDAGDESPPYPAFAPDLPTILAQGGPTMPTPKVVPILFANDTSNRKTLIPAFLQALAGSAYWTTTTKEYGVNSLTIAQTVQLVENAAANIGSQSAVETWLSNAIQTSKLPANDANTIYALYYPQTTVINLSGLGAICVGWGGYHSEISVSGKPVVYSVVGGCASYGAKLNPGETVMGDDYTTGITTHELVEAVTDPYPGSNPAYRNIDQQHRAWGLYLYGGEVGDTCEKQPGVFYKDMALGYVVQRMWSNKNAAAGHDPCVPSAIDPYVVAYPQYNGPILQLNGTLVQDIKLASDGPTNGPFNVKVIDFATENGLGTQLQLSLAPASGKNGDTLKLTIKVLATDPSQQEGYILESEYMGVKRRNAGYVHQ
jgi:hypothetical protein